MRKGMIEVQFNWIFILMVGAIILLFFIGLTNEIKKSKEKELAGTVMDNIQAIMTGAQVNPGVASRLDVPNVLLNFKCDTECSRAGCPSSFQFENSGVPRYTEIDILFTLNHLQGDVIHTWTQEWYMPFKVSNFLYITNPRVRVYLIKDGDNPDSVELAGIIRQRMRDNTNLDLREIEPGQIQNIQYNNERIIRFVAVNYPDVAYEVSQGLKDSEAWDIIWIDGDEKSGTATFPRVENGEYVRDTDKEYPYLGLPSVFGAIVSEDFNFYKCNMIKALLRLRSVNEVYKIKSEKLSGYYAGDMRCEFYYDITLSNQFEKIDNAIADLNSPDVGSLMDAYSQLEDLNTQTQLKSCTRIY